MPVISTIRRTVPTRRRMTLTSEEAVSAAKPVTFRMLRSGLRTRIGASDTAFFSAMGTLLSFRNVGPL